jgi:hypothetical protein
MREIVRSHSDSSDKMEPEMYIGQLLTIQFCAICEYGELNIYCRIQCHCKPDQYSNMNMRPYYLLTENSDMALDYFLK